MTQTQNTQQNGLHIVATPIGNMGDITLRAIEILKSCTYIIGEEHRPTSTLLKRLNINQSQKQIYLLNEHSKKNDLEELVKLCAENPVALVTDCGTPVFSDPGSDLIKACRQKKIHVTTLPGASSLMGLISLSSQKLTQFVFVGFLPANKEERAQKLKELKSENRPWVLMDTPYRLQSTLEDLSQLLPNHRALLAMNLTQADELVLEGTFKELKANCTRESSEFMILRYGN